MPLHSVVTTGSAIAALLANLATPSEGFGLLLGTVRDRRVQAATDTAESQITQRQDACITAYVCCPPGLSSTLVAGEPQVELLQAMLGQLQSDQILGWFAYRPVTSLQPTSQECMITSSMLAALHSLNVTMQSYQPLFAVLSSLPRHDGCSLEIQQRLFVLNSHSHQLEAIDLQIRNLGERGPLVRQYQPVLPVSIIPKAPAFTFHKGKATPQPPSSAGSGSNEVTESMARAVAYTGLQHQVEALESMYRKAVRQLETLAHKACTDAV